MNWKIILLLFILFYHKEVKSKKSNLHKENDLFASEDLLLFVEEPSHLYHRERRNVEAAETTTEEVGSGSPETTFTTFMTSTVTSNSPQTTETETTTSSTVTTTPGEIIVTTATPTLTETTTASGTTSTSTATTTNTQSTSTTTTGETTSTSTKTSTEGTTTSSATSTSTSTTTTTETTSTSTTTSTTQNTRIITSSTSTTTATTSTSTTTTTAPPPTRMLSGPNDQSILYYWKSNLGSRKSMPIFFTNINLNIFGNSYTFLRVHPNGVVSFPSTVSSTALNALNAPIANFTSMPVIAPLWTSSILTKNSDITFGEYTQKTLTSTLSAQISSLMRNSSSSIIREASLSTYVSEIAYIITWKNVQLTTNPADIATYQIILTTSLTQETSYVIFNYESVTLNMKNMVSTQTMFIGYSDVAGYMFTNPYSYNPPDATGDPNQVATSYGDSGNIGVWVYDMNYKPSDACTLWYESLYVSPDYNPILPQNQSFTPCSSDLAGAQVNPSFQIYKNPLWQSNSTCYKLITPVQNYLQQFCCYDKASGALQTSGPNAGFFYGDDNFGNIVNHGFLCCYQQPWSDCSKFYKIYPPSIATNDGSGFVQGTGGGDPHIITFDHVEYPFNGYGKFIMSRSLDASFEVQIATELFRNVNGSTHLTGTFIRSVAIRSIFNRASTNVIQVDLVDYFASNPYLVLYLDQNNHPFDNFTRNMNFQRDFPCDDDSSRTCVTILQNTEKGAQILLTNGVSIQVKISKVKLSEFESRSWLSVNIVLPKSYSNLVEGLMGNYNAQPSDDLRSRSGLIVSDANNDEAIYNALVTWRVTNSEGDEDLFIASSHSSKLSKASKFTIRATHDYSPTFYKQLGEIDVVTRTQCNHSRQCIYDTIVTGLLSMGLHAVNESNSFKRTIHILNNEAPLIRLHKNTIEIDWSLESSVVPIVADVSDPNGFQIRVVVENASDYTTNIETVDSTHSIVRIDYRIRRGELPSFKIIATDSKSRTSVAQVNGILICDCRSFDSENQCLFNRVQTIVNPYISFVACHCADFYTGLYCENVRDECASNNLCHISPQTAHMKCRSLSLSEQKQTGRGHVCLGECPEGFTRDEYQTCIDINECENPSACPSGASCINQIGGYKCDCGAGRTYKYRKCQNIDYCMTEFNKCHSICTSSSNPQDTAAHVTCSCYPGYDLDPKDGFTCVKVNDFPGCDLLQCSHMCTQDEETGRAVCKCHKGYHLSPDGKTCLNINECQTNNGGCPENCTDLQGSFRCECDAGSYYNISTNTCHVCPSQRYGLDCAEICLMGPNTLRCDPVLGSICNPGFTGPNCLSTANSCENAYLPKNMECRYRSNKYEIICKSGYKFNSRTNKCDLIDNCASNPCPLNSQCLNGVNNFVCICPRGFTYIPERRDCEDIDECIDPTICPINSFCSNKIGSYECICDNWFVNTNQDIQNPVCEDLNECSMNISRCLRESEECVNLAGSYTCECRPGYVYSHIRVGCVLLSDLLPTVTLPPAPVQPPFIINSGGMAKSGHATTVGSDQTGLFVLLIIPFVVFLLLIILAAFVCYCWFKIRRMSETRTKSNRISKHQINNMQNSNIISNEQWSMASSQGGLSGEVMKQPGRSRRSYNHPVMNANLIDLNSVDIREDSAATSAARSIYRTNYTSGGFTPQTPPALRRVTSPPPLSQSHLEEFLRSLEEQARAHQRTTIARPYSLGAITTPAGFAFPTGYYETTTPYSEFVITDQQQRLPSHQVRLGGRERRRSRSERDLDLDHADFDGGFTNSAYEPDDNDDLNEIIEAFTPNVKIPRPKIHKNPMKIFKFGNKSDDRNT